MSVAELAGREHGFERTPPHDVAAEQCVLGGMLLSPEAIAEVIEVLRTQDFYRPAHQVVYDAVIDLYGRGEPADAVTLSNELTKRGDLGRVGGAPYLHTLIEAVSTAANAAYYARIVRERSVLRRLVEVGTRIAQLGYSTDGYDADELVDRAQAEVYGISDKRAGEDYAALSEIMPGALDEIEAIGSRGGQLVGVPTGFADLDSLTNGLHPGQLIIVAARPAMGKALALDTPLPTPGGWTTMGEVRAGDLLIGASGRPTRVLAATPVMTGRPCYEVEFSDGTMIVADAEHQWLTETRAARRSAQQAATGHNGCRNQRTFPTVKTTAEIAATLRCDTADRRANHAVPVAAPADLPERDLPLPPYTLGAWLAGGHSAGSGLTTADPEIIRNIEAEGIPVTRGRLCRESHGSVPAVLRKMGLLGNKHIPAGYLRSSESQRRALLAGLLDTAGHVSRTGTVRFAVTDERLARDTHELILSLGYRATMTTGRANERGSNGSVRYSVTFTPADKVFLLTRKLARQNTREHPATRRRYIVDARRVPSVPVRCVQVDAADHLFLAGRTWIPTHNSTLALDFARAASIRHQLSSVIFSLEMSRNEITMRLLSAEARVGLHAMRSGLMNDDDWTRLARRMGEVADAPLFIDDSPNMSMMEIRAKCRRLKQRHDLRLVVVDYLQLMSSGKRVESRQVEVSEFSRTLKLLAKELEVPVVALSQLNRGPEQRTDKKPMVSDLRESGCLTADTRLLRADNGAEVTLGELVASGARDIPVWSLDERLKLVPRTLTHAFPSGVKETFRVRLASGREVQATANHPFLTYDGWRALGELAHGARVAVPRHMPTPLCTRVWPTAEVILLAHLIGDGSFVKRQPIRYASRDEENLAAVAKAAEHFGIIAKRDDYAAAGCAVLRLAAPYRLARGKRNPIAEWLDSLRLFGLRSHEKFVPEQVFSLPDDQLRLFIRHLWATDGSVTTNRAGQVRIYYGTTSARLARDVQLLLLRLDVKSRLRPVGNNYGKPQWTLDVGGVEDQQRFLKEVGVYGERGVNVSQALARLDQMTAVGRFDTIPSGVWSQVRDIMVERSLTRAQLQQAVGTVSRGDLNNSISPSRNRLVKIARVLDDADLEMLATNDVFWDEIASIESIGDRRVYDATVMGTHNFVANGIHLKNSIEQDADVVILLHREDAYERESPRAGEADLIVGKHRNGPTATVTVAFQGHYSRFVDMAPG